MRKVRIAKDVNRTVTLNNQGQWSGAFENLAPGTYRVEESRVDGYTASYNPENQLVTVTATTCGRLRITTT